MKHKLNEWRVSVKAPVPNQKNPHYDADKETLAIQSKRDRFFENRK